jgi:hypothetical protein
MYPLTRKTSELLFSPAASPSSVMQGVGRLNSCRPGRVSSVLVATYPPIGGIQAQSKVTIPTSVCQRGM